MNPPFSQTKQYYRLLEQEGKKPFYIREDDKNYLLLFKTYKTFLGVPIPFFCKISAYEGFVYNDRKKLDRILKETKRLISSPFTLKAQITTHPCINLDEKNFFNQEAHTYILKLSPFQSGEDYLQSLSSKLRAEVRKGIKQELTIKEVKDENDLKTYFDFVNKNRQGNNIHAISEEHFKLSWKIFSSEKLVRYFLIYKDGEPMASQGVNVSHNGFTLVQTSTSKRSYELKLKSNDVMQYLMVELAIKENMDYVDWGGAQPGSTDPKMISIDKFKAKWGGQIVSYPVYMKGY